ncbi:hypothetical protein HELRODRAFT_186253 [Helobdella robusta]|uniref:CCR4-NOT transcription complex subunit 11 n=1 Tax=Helobdella robusta TaxID=6412 RepID=T1FNV5_HELRO|nr:hypothetical protein HELRODRAFT_186253 [Helobdella robusta]ESO11359.1 hypothetical protein HELRODRAFT_186253 [Helobdella robusta]
MTTPENHAVRKGFNLQEIHSLLSLLSEESSQSQTFEQLANAFKQQFPNKMDNFHFKVGLALVTMLKSVDLLKHGSERLFIMYLLVDFYSSDPISLNPFLPVIIKQLSDDAVPTNLSASEKYFLSQLITSPIKELSKKTPSQVLQMDVSMLPPIEITGLQLIVTENQSEMPIHTRSYIPCIVPQPDIKPMNVEGLHKPGQTDADIQRQTLEAIMEQNNSFFDWSVGPEFITLIPPLHTALDEELSWLQLPASEHQLHWDQAMLQSTTALNDEGHKLLLKAISGPLSIQQQHQLQQFINRNPKLVHHVGLTAAKLPDLVEHNPLVAVEVLYRLMQAGHQISDYFGVLVNMEVSLHSMEVVNRLTTVCDLPTEFIHLYISNCISTCDTTKDKYLQCRYVRLVCVFLQSLIRNKVIDIRDIFIEVQAFCIEFSKIREAGALFRLLKTLEGSDQLNQNASSSEKQPTNR